MKTTQLLLALLLASTTSLFAQGGSLTPPGAPGVTMKTLDEVEPRTPISSLPFAISAPGSYYLTGNLTVASGNGISVGNVDGVSVDLNGFSLIGQAGTGTGVLVGAANRTLEIRNGTIRDWAANGIAISSADARITNVRTANNGTSGINISGEGAIVKDCIASSNGSYGIYTENKSVISGCNSHDNGNDGIRAGSGSTVSGCTSSTNTGDGFEILGGSVVKSCTAFENGVAGLYAAHGGGGSHFSDCVAAGNGSFGCYVRADGTSFVSCVSTINDSVGFHSGFSDKTFFSKCFAYRNGVSVADSGAHGFLVRGNSRISDCVSKDNEGKGIEDLNGRHHIDGCTVSNNKAGGIDTVTNSTVIRNVTRDNTGFDINPSGGAIAPIQSPSTATNPFANLQ